MTSATKSMTRITALLTLLTVVSCSTPPLVAPAPDSTEYSSLEGRAVHAISPHAMVVVGNLYRQDGTPEGMILSTETDGRTWRRYASEVHDLRNLVFQTVHYTDRLRGWVGGVRTDADGQTRAVVFRTSDGGNHWREVPLLIGNEMALESLHSLNFTSDTDGSIVALGRDTDGALKETEFSTTDAGRSWLVSRYREGVAVSVESETTSMVDEQRGFRVRPSQLSGVAVVEATASSGLDWMPVCDLTVRNLDTYYGLGR